MVPIPARREQRLQVEARRAPALATLRARSFAPAAPPGASQNLNLSLEYETIKHDDFEKSVGKFYICLLANQEPLGAEFETVLHKNLCDLYES